MTPEEFRRAGHELIDWVADYRERVARREFPVMARNAPGRLARGACRQSPPQEPEEFAAIRRDLDELILPACTHWQDPRFSRLFPVQRPAGRRARRPGEHRPRATRAQLAVESGAHRARRSLPRLVAPDARAFRALVGRHPGYGFHRHLRGAGMRARARLQPFRHARRPAGPAAAADGVRVIAGAQLGGEGRAARGIRAREPARDSGGREFRHGRPMRWPRRSRQIAPPGASPAPSSPPAAPPRPRPSIRSPTIAQIARVEELWLHVDAAMAGCAMILPGMPRRCGTGSKAPIRWW